MILTGVDFSFPWELAMIEWLQAHITGALMSFVSALSIPGETGFLIVVLSFLYWSYDKQMGKRVGQSVLMACVWNPMIKNIALRRRPYFDHDGIRILRPVEPGADLYNISAQGYSFPSGHSANSTAAYAALAACGRKRLLTAAAILLPLLTGFSRICVGAHYPTDVLCGWLLGGIVILITSWL